MLVMDMEEDRQGKDFQDVLVQEHHLDLTVHVLQVLDLIHLAILDPLFLHGLKIQELEVGSIHLDADLLLHSVQEVHQDAMPGDDIPLQEEGVNHGPYHVLLGDLLTLLGLLLKLQIFLPPRYPVHHLVLQILN